MAQFWKPVSALTEASIDRDGDAQPVIDTNKFERSRGGESLTLRQQREQLPIAQYRLPILYALEKYTSLILVGETGSGKSTQLPTYLHEAGWTAEGRCVVCTQPRKIAAITVATRVAEEFGCTIGEEVGYGVRFNFNCSSKTVIKYYTDGVLLRETLSDPLLSKYSVIIVDEAHQRSLHSDMLLGLLKKIQRKRSDLRIVVMSATLDALPLKTFFETNIGGDPAKDTALVMSVQGRQHAVDMLYLQKPARHYLKACVQSVLDIDRAEGPGDMLVFLPGAEEIDTAINLLEEAYSGDTMVFLPLYATMSHSQQMWVFQRPPKNVRKVVVATNIAETSITIDGIRFVVDCGFVKANFFDVRSGVDALITCPVSKAEAAQRAGRAGRTQSGKCFRLMTEEHFDNELPAFSLPEMQRTDISWAVLQLKALGVDDVLHFDYLSAPHPDSLVYALELLHSLKAIDTDGNITQTGRFLAEMPAEPRHSSVLLNSLTFGCSEEILSVLAMCSVGYPFVPIRNHRNPNSELNQKVQSDIEAFAVVGSDHLTLLKIYNAFIESGCSSSWCASVSLLFRVVDRARVIRQQLLSLLKKYSKEVHHMDGVSITSCGQDNKCVLKCIVSGFFSHAAKLGHDGKYYTVRGKVAVEPHPQSVAAQFGAPPEWVIFNEIFLSKSAQIKEISAIEPLWLMDLAKHYYIAHGFK